MEELQYYLQWMLKIIQIKIIHSLGGRTIEETSQHITERFNYFRNKGYDKAYYEMYKYVESLNGLSKQEWIDKVWKYINKKVYDD